MAGGEGIDRRPLVMSPKLAFLLACCTVAAALLPSFSADPPPARLASHRSPFSTLLGVPPPPSACRRASTLARFISILRCSTACSFVCGARMMDDRRGRCGSSAVLQRDGLLLARPLGLEEEEGSPGTKVGRPERRDLVDLVGRGGTAAPAAGLGLELKAGTLAARESPGPAGGDWARSRELAGLVDRRMKGLILADWAGGSGTSGLEGETARAPSELEVGS